MAALAPGGASDSRRTGLNRDRNDSDDSESEPEESDDEVEAITSHSQAESDEGTFDYISRLYFLANSYSHSILEDDSDLLVHESDLDEQQFTAAYGGEAADPESDALPTTVLNDIKIVYHPSAGRLPDIYSFEYYCNTPTEEKHANDSGSEAMESNSNRRPWNPFPTRADFELAEVMLDGHLNKQQIERILAIIWKAMKGPDSSDTTDRVTIQNSADLSNIWDHALKTRATGVCNSFDS